MAALQEEIVARSLDPRVLESERAREAAQQRRALAHEDLAALQADRAATDYAKSIYWRTVAQNQATTEGGASAPLALQPQHVDGIRQLLGISGD
eukprot:COSAG06_NODE_551_length_14398_cov_5.447304_15_plen_94_part_00